MSIKLKLVLGIAIFCNINLYSQNSPLKSLSLKTEPTNVPADTSGITLFYSCALIANDSSEINQVIVKLSSTSNDSIINSQTFNIPTINGVYQTEYFSNGIIKDGKAIYILLGNFRSKETLMIHVDIIDDKNKTYLNHITTE